MGQAEAEGPAGVPRRGLAPEGAEARSSLALAAAADSELRALEYVPPLVVAQPAVKEARAAAAMKAAAAAGPLLPAAFFDPSRFCP